VMRLTLLRISARVNGRDIFYLYVATIGGG